MDDRGAASIPAVSDMDAGLLPGRGAPPCDAPTLRAATAYAITSRRSVRGFRDTPVPHELVRALIEVASRAPSGSNIQPWRIYVLAEAALRRVTAALTDAARAGEAERREYEYYPTRWRSPYLERRRACGWGLYELAGVARGDRDGTRRQALRNFDFFGAPAGLVFTIDSDLEQGSWLDYGMFLQALMTAARGFGLDTCPQVSVAGYPDLLRREIGIPAEQMVVCGMALGWADPAEPTNALRTDREPVEAFTHFLRD